MRRAAVIDIVALSRALWSGELEFLQRWSAGGAQAAITEGPPGLTCASQATYLTGAYPSSHGVVGNGWYHRDTCEVRMWHQSSRLLRAPRLWEGRGIKVANLFWWFNMYSGVDYSVTPRPIYRADGRKIPAVYTNPPGLSDRLERELGQFPLGHFWGPGASIRSSRWIAEAAKQVELSFRPDLSLIYLPHLDYNLQRLGPEAPESRRDLREIDALLGELVSFLERREIRVIVLSEYGIRPVGRCVEINRALRERGLLRVRDELGCESLDAGASPAFALADHQLAHLYVNDRARLAEARAVAESQPGVARVLEGAERAEARLDHERAGDLVLLSQPDAWFSYRYWLDESRAPDFARTIDIHRKPGYDPLELFADPRIAFPKLRIASFLLKKKLGQRALLRIVPLDPTLVRGSHGTLPVPPEHLPLLLCSEREIWSGGEIRATQIASMILAALGRAAAMSSAA